MTPVVEHLSWRSSGASEPAYIVETTGLFGDVGTEGDSHVSQGEIDGKIIDTIYLPPTEHVHHALSSNHDINTGLDELIDNSIDAGAENIAIVIHTVGDRISKIVVDDDGQGMDNEGLNNALRVGLHLSTGQTSIGRYGMGMKEASLSNASTMTIISKKNSEFPRARVLKKGSFTVGILNDQATHEIWSGRKGLISVDQGTTVIWENLSQVYSGLEKELAAEFQSKLMTSLNSHLGLRYHRFLDEQAISIGIYVQSSRARRPTLSLRPESINPFRYRRSGAPGYPVQLTEGGKAGAPGITAHIWPPSKSQEFTLGTNSDQGHQGFFVYDERRLITAGGWHGYRSGNRLLKYLRIEITDSRILDQYLTVSPQKDSVRLDQSFHRFIGRLRGVADRSLTFEGVLDAAVAASREANRHRPNADPVVPPGRGMAPELKSLIEREGKIERKEALGIRWGRTPDRRFVYLDKKNSEIILHTRFREAINPSKGRLNDAPVVKTLLYLLFNEYFRKDRAGSKISANVEFFLNILNEAAEVEERDRQQYSSATFELFSEAELKKGPEKR